MKDYQARRREIQGHRQKKRQWENETVADIDIEAAFKEKNSRAFFQWSLEDAKYSNHKFISADIRLYLRSQKKLIMEKRVSHFQKVLNKWKEDSLDIVLLRERERSAEDFIKPLDE